MLTHEPSPNALHKFGRAIDMNIRWTGTIIVKMKNGTPVPVRYTSVNSNNDLIKIGESFGVKKLRTDAVHWSDNGKQIWKKANLT